MKINEIITEGSTGPGLWANIHAKRNRIKSGSGERMRKPGSKGAPTDKNFKDAASEDVAEARAGTASFRSGNAQRAELNAMSTEERKAHEDKRAEQQRKRDDARMERERQRNAAKKDVAEGQEVDASVVVGKLYDIIDQQEDAIKNADYDRQVRYATTVRDRAVKALNMIKTNSSATNAAWEYFQNGTQGVSEEYHPNNSRYEIESQGQLAGMAGEPNNNPYGEPDDSKEAYFWNEGYELGLQIRRQRQGVAEDIIEETYEGDEFYESYGDLWYDEEMLNEAEYQGRKVQLGKPMQGDVKKFKVYVKDPSTGNIKKVNFGDPNMKIRKSNPGARKSFRARHNCDNPGPRTKARYWSCRKW